MQPYDGLESASYNPYQYLRAGRILEIFDNNKFEVSVGSNVVNSSCYFSVLIEWLDRPGDSGSFVVPTSKIDLHYPFLGKGWGIQYKPSLGDVVLCGFRMGGYAVMLGYFPASYYDKVNGVHTEGDTKTGYTFRNIVEGEYCLKSKNGAEWYLDDKGSIHLITRNQSQTRTITNTFTNSNEVVVEDNPDIEVVIGKTYEHKAVGESKQIDFTKEVKSSNGNSTRVSVQDYASGTKIIIDTAGNIEIVQPSGSKFTVSGSDSAEILGSSSLALKSELQALTDKYNDLVLKFNLHVHTGVTTGSDASLATLTQGTAAISPQGTQKLLGS